MSEFTLELSLTIRAVLYREDGCWIAHCLEFDLIGHGDTRESALQMLTQAIEIQVEQTIEHENLDNLFAPADGKFFAMFAAGKDVQVGDLNVQPVVSPIVERMDTREYSRAA